MFVQECVLRLTGWGFLINCIKSWVFFFTLHSMYETITEYAVKHKTNMLQLPRTILPLGLIHGFCLGYPCKLKAYDKTVDMIYHDKAVSNV